MLEHNKRKINTSGLSLVKQMLFVIALLFIASCAQQKEQAQTKQYQLGSANIETSIAARQFNLPDYINISIAIESDEDSKPTISIDKKYKSQLKLEQFNKNSEVGSNVNLVLHQYQFVFSALKADTINFPGFKIEIDQQLLQTDSLSIIVASAVSDGGTELKPVIKSLPIKPGSILWIIVFASAIAAIFFYRQKKRNHAIPEAIEVDVKGNLIKELILLKEQNLSAAELDKALNTFLKNIEAHVKNEAYQQLIADWKVFFTKQSYALNLSESERRQQLVAFLSNHHTLKNN